MKLLKILCEKKIKVKKIIQGITEFNNEEL